MQDEEKYGKNMDLSEKFEIIRQYFEERDRERMMKGKVPFHETSHGLWGAAGMLDMYEFFMKIRLERFRKFADYGSGDGRITLIAALFAPAIGIEGDEEVHERAVAAKEELVQKIPELKQAELKCSDYYKEDHTEYDMIFTFPDHPFPRAFEEKLKESYKGWLIVYNQIHVPYGLKKGKTYWIQQLPIGSYPINIADENLFEPNEKNTEDPAISDW